MRIGILTFHWPENYGAVLQAYALQSYLEDRGHDVHIINYRPLNRSLYYISILLHPSEFNNLRKISLRKLKNTLLNRFRNKYLHLTKRYYSCEQLMNTSLDFDLLISGSDQVLNPSFTCWGEGKPTATYYLPFGRVKKIGYALSFGCTDYPADARVYASKWIRNFGATGVREDTGINVLHQLGYKKEQMVVPDPTILYGNHLFDKIFIRKPEKRHLCVYVLRHTVNFRTEDVFYMDEEHKPIDMETWLGQLTYAKGLVTNSYHGMIMSILAHVPFVALLETNSESGMNDRFKTLLGRLKLMERILPIDASESAILSKLDLKINWEGVDKLVADYRMVGEDFLSKMTSPDR